MNPISLDILLATNDFQQPEPSALVHNLLPLGLTLLYGPHHSGKSLLTLHLALTVASGTSTLGSLPTTQTSVLYLGLHDTQQRMALRARKLLNTSEIPTSFAWSNILSSTSSSNTDPIATLDHWLSEHPQTRLIVIDSLQGLSPTPSMPLTPRLEYTLLHGLKTLADTRRIAILVTAHLSSKALRTFPDTQPTNAALADTLLILKRDHNSPDATLCIASHCLPYQELALHLPSDTLCWTLLGSASDQRLSQQRQDILALLEEHHSDSLTPKQVASLLHKDPRAITKLLFDMSHANQIRVVSRGKYTTLKTETTPIRSPFFGNIGNVLNNGNNHDNGTDVENNNGNRLIASAHERRDVHVPQPVAACTSTDRSISNDGDNGNDRNVGNYHS